MLVDEIVNELREQEGMPVLESLRNPSRNIQGLEGISPSDMEGMIEEHIHRKMIEGNVTETEAVILDFAIIGSRGRHTARPDSDLDVIVEYEGTIREDDFFYILNSEDEEYGKFAINGIEVDFNPIRKEESGTLDDFLKRSEEYDRDVLEKMGISSK